MTTALVDRVRIAFTTDPFSASPSWTDLSTDVQLYSGITVTRGKGDRYGQIQPGTISLTLDNPTGAYTPNYAAGSNYPNVVIGKRLQWHTSIDNGVTWFPRFDGFIDTYQTSWDTINGSWASCVVQATDRTKFMARQVFIDSLVETIIRADGAVDYWPLYDDVGTYYPVNLTGSTVLAPFFGDSTITYGVDGIPNGDGETAVQVSPGALKARSTSQAYTNVWTIGCYVRVPQVGTVGDSPNPITLFDTTGSNYIALALRIGPGNSGEAVLEVSDPSIGAYDLPGLPTSQARLDDGNWHHIAGVYDSAAAGGTLTLHVDGDAVVNATGVGTITTDYYLWSINSSAYSGTPPYIIQQAHTALFTHAYNTSVLGPSGLTGFAGDTSFDRVNRITSFANITPTDVGSPGTTSMSAWAGVKGKSIDQMLQEVQATENGAIYFGVDGTLKVVGRRNFDNPTVAITLPTGSYEADLQHVTDDSQMVNQVTATGSSGNRQQVTNAALSYLGTVNVDVALDTTSDTEALAYAQRRLIDGDPNNPRFDTVSLDLISMIPITTPYNGVTVITAFWNSDLTSAIQCTGLPTGSAPAASMTQIIQGYTETRTHDSYSVKFNTTAAFSNVWKLEDATLGVLDSTTVLAY